MKLDILKMELEKRLPHWLSPAGRNSHKIKAIREKHRARHLAKLAQDFDPNEKRD